MKLLVTPLCAALLCSSISFAEEPKPLEPAKPSAEETAAYKAKMHAKLDEIEARLKRHRQLLAQRAQALESTRTEVAE